MALQKAHVRQSKSLLKLYVFSEALVPSTARPPLACFAASHPAPSNLLQGLLFVLN